MEKSEIVIRFSVFSKEEESISYMEEVKELLPNPNSYYKLGDKKVLSDGRIFPETNKETSFDFISKYKSFSLEDVHQKWLESWSGYFKSLKFIKSNFNFDFVLNYEITVYGKQYPSMYFPVQYTSVLSDIGIDLSLYIYDDILN